jgi:hypothetical protein
MGLSCPNLAICDQIWWNKAKEIQNHASVPADFPLFCLFFPISKISQERAAKDNTYIYALLPQLRSAHDPFLLYPLHQKLSLRLKPLLAGG